MDLICKGEGVIAGLNVFARTFELLDKDIEITFMAKDGDKVNKGDLLAKVKGDIRVLLFGRTCGIKLFAENEWNCHIYKSSSKFISRQ